MPIRYLADLRDTPQQDWVWHGFLAPRNITLLSAHPKAGKTTFTFHLLRALWTEAEHLGLSLRPVPVLYISEEADTLIARRCDAMGFSEMWPIGFVTPEPGQRWENTLRYVTGFLQMYQSPLVVIDTLSRHWSAENENDATQVEQALRPLLDIVRSSMASVLCIHHMRKSGGSEGLAARGSSALGASFDVLVELSRLSPWDTSNRRRLESLSRYEETPQSVTIALGDTGYTVVNDEGMGSERAILNVVLANDGVNAETVAEQLGISDRYAREVLARFVARGQVLRTGTGTKRSPFLYVAAPVTPPD